MNYKSIIFSISILISVLSACSKDETTLLSSPVVTTSKISSISSNSAVMGGDVLENGGSEITERGVCWNNSLDPTVYMKKKRIGVGVGNFNATVNNLMQGYEYFVRAYAINSEGISYGDNISFTTLADYSVVETKEVENIESTSAIFKGFITSNGGAEITDKGFCWDVSPEPDINKSKKSVGNGMGGFSAIISELNRGTTYYMRAYSVNSKGISYGVEKQFTTLSNYYMFTCGNIWSYTLHNKQDKLLYFFTSKDFSDSKNITLVVYNYALKEVIAEKDFGNINPLTHLHSLGNNNGQLELYILKGNTVHILNPITLEEIDTLIVSTVDDLISVQLRNNLIFLGPYRAENYELLVYNRTTLEFVSTSAFDVFARSMITFNDEVSKNIYCASFPQYSNSSNFILDEFSQKGEYLSSKVFKYQSSGSLIRSSEISDLILHGGEGLIYSKAELINSKSFVNLTNSKIKTSGGIIDMQIDSEANFIYTIQDNYFINKYDISNPTTYEQIKINEKGQNLFVDGNKLIVVDYLFGPSPKVYLSMYE